MKAFGDLGQTGTNCKTNITVNELFSGIPGFV